MNKYCCICKYLIDDEDDYNRVGQDYYCLHCSNNDLVPCPGCETMLNPDKDTAFSGPFGHLFCSAECLDAMTMICTGCERSFVTVDGGSLCPFCTGEYENDED